MAGIKIDTAPNQNVFVVHREAIGKNFISISKENYSKAYRDMSKSVKATNKQRQRQKKTHFTATPIALKFRHCIIDFKRIQIEQS